MCCTWLLTHLQLVEQLGRIESFRAARRVVVPAAMVHRAVARRVCDEHAQADGALPRQLSCMLQPSSNVLGHVFAYRCRVMVWAAWRSVMQSDVMLGCGRKTDYHRENRKEKDVGRGDGGL